MFNLKSLKNSKMFMELEEELNLNKREEKKISIKEITESEDYDSDDESSINSEKNKKFNKDKNIKQIISKKNVNIKYEKDQSSEESSEQISRKKSDQISRKKSDQISRKKSDQISRKNSDQISRKKSDQISRKNSEQISRKNSEQNEFNNTRKNSEPKENNTERNQLEVIVAGISYNLKEEDIKEDFTECGEMTRFYMPKNEENRIKGIAFIGYKDKQSVENALQFNNTYYGGRTINVELSKNKNFKNRSNTKMKKSTFNTNNSKKTGKAYPSIIIRNLNFTVIEEDLYPLFDSFGKIKNLNIIKDKDQKSKGFGFIDYEDSESASKALTRNNDKLKGRNMRIEYSVPKEIIKKDDTEVPVANNSNFNENPTEDL